MEKNHKKTMPKKVHTDLTLQNWRLDPGDNQAAKSSQGKVRGIEQEIGSEIQSLNIVGKISKRGDQ